MQIKGKGQKWNEGKKLNSPQVVFTMYKASEPGQVYTGIVTNKAPTLTRRVYLSLSHSGSLD